MNEVSLDIRYKYVDVPQRDIFFRNRFCPKGVMEDAVRDLAVICAQENASLDQVDIPSWVEKLPDPDYFDPSNGDTGFRQVKESHGYLGIIDACNNQVILTLDHLFDPNWVLKTHEQRSEPCNPRSVYGTSMSWKGYNLQDQLWAALTILSHRNRATFSSEVPGASLLERPGFVRASPDMVAEERRHEIKKGLMMAQPFEWDRKVEIDFPCKPSKGAFYLVNNALFTFDGEQFTQLEYNARS